MTRTTTDDRCQHQCPACWQEWDCQRRPGDCRELTRFAVCEECQEAEAIALTMLQGVEEAGVA